MKRFRIICILIVLCMLACGTPYGKPAETPAPTAKDEKEAAEPAEETPVTAVPTPKDEKEAALLYAGERVNLYCGRAEDSWGVIIEEFTWVGKNFLYQPFPGTQGMDGLTVTEIRTEADEYLSEALFYIRYLDADGQPRVYCLDHPASDFLTFFPFSDEEGVVLSENELRMLEDAMLIGYLYEDGLDGTKPEEWEAAIQREILNALYYNYEDALPPYLKGETDEEFPDCSVVTQEELDGFFRCTVDRPNLVPDRIFEGEEVPELLPGQVPMWPTDFEVWPTVRKAVRVSDGEYLLYGNVGMGEGWCPAGVICRVVAADGYLGWRVVDTEVCGATDMQYDARIAFVPNDHP